MASTPKKTAPRISKTQANTNSLRDAIAAMHPGSADQYTALSSPDARLHGFPAGIEDVDSLSVFHTTTAELYPGASVTLDVAIAERDRVATRYTWRAANGHGLDLVAQGGAIVRFADGRIAECWNQPAELAAVAPEPSAN